MDKKTLISMGLTIPENNFKNYTTPTEFKEYIEKHAGEEVLSFWNDYSKCFICGGFVRSFYEKSKPNDIDIYFLDEKTFFDFDLYIKSKGFTVFFESERAISYSKSESHDHIVIQAVKFIFGPIDEILKEFDFTIVMAAASCEKLVIHEDFGYSQK